MFVLSIIMIMVLFSVLLFPAFFLTVSYSHVKTINQPSDDRRTSINIDRDNFSDSSLLISSVINSTINMTTSVRITKSVTTRTQIHSHEDFLFIVTAHSEQINMFSYWVPWAKVAGLSKFLVFAMDDETAAKAQSFKLNTYNPFASSQSTTYIEKLAYRHEFFASLLQEGVSFISVGANALVLDMTALSLPAERDIFLYARAIPLKNANDRIKLNADVFGLSAASGTKAIEFMRRVGHCFDRANTSTPNSSRRLIWLSPAQISTTYYQSCMEKSLSDMRKEIKRKQELRIANQSSGKRASLLQQAQRKGFSGRRSGSRDEETETVRDTH